MKRIGNNIISQAITTDLASEPVTLAEVKAYGNITYTDYDTLLTLLMKVARIQLQGISGLMFGEGTVLVHFTHSGERSIKLPWRNYAEATALEWRSCRLNDWTVVSLDDEQWEVEANRFMGTKGHWKITYTTEDLTLPEDIKTAIKAQTIHLWQNRDNNNSKGIDSIAAALIQPYISGDRLL